MPTVSRRCNFHLSLPPLFLLQVEAHPLMLAPGQKPKYPPITGKDYLLDRLYEAHHGTARPSAAA
jgi:hypothetical protein